MTAENSNDMSTSELFGRTLLKGYEQASESVRNKMIPGAKKGVKTILALLIALFAASVFLVALGIALGHKEMVVVGCILKAGVSISVLAMLSPIGIAFESISKGTLSGKKYVRFMASCFTFQLLIAGVILFSPMPLSLSTFFTLTFASCLLALSIAAESEGVKIVSGIFFALSILTLFLPTWRERADRSIRILNEPQLLSLHRGDVASGKKRFYVNGKPVVWYSVTRTGQYELFDAEGNHDQSQARLRPITDSILEIIKSNEDLISPRNFIQETKPPPPLPITGTTDTPLPPPPPESSEAVSAPSFDFSGQWSFRWEKPPGYPGYKNQPVSDWFSARIESTDNEVRIVILDQNGQDLAYFPGYRNNDGTYSGRWTMCDSSGKGYFSLNLKNANFIEGTMTDETVDRRPIVIRLHKS